MSAPQALSLTLTLTTPLALMLDRVPIAAFRGEDETGGFGILPGHADFLTVIDAGVLRWRVPGEATRYAAVRGAVLTGFPSQLSSEPSRNGTTSPPLSSTCSRITSGSERTILPPKLP